MVTWTECLEQGGQVDVIYTDLQKAFDKILHKRLISKLHSYGIHRNLIGWIECFLANRKAPLATEREREREKERERERYLPCLFRNVIGKRGTVFW